jgi:hypothetical protein
MLMTAAAKQLLPTSLADCHCSFNRLGLLSPPVLPAAVQCVLLQASCATMAWLDVWAKLLLQQQYSLEQQLAKFTPVIASQGLVRGTPQRSDYGSPGVPVTPTGGRVSAAQSFHLAWLCWVLVVR